MYRCERCGKTFTRFSTPGQCPHCKVYASVRCSGCGHTAPSSRFTDHGNRCPKCGSGVAVPGGGGAGQSPSEEICKGCGRTIAGTDWTCPHCGTTRWGMVLGTTAVGLLGIVAAVAPGSPIWLRIVGGLFGLAFFVGIGEIWTGLRSRRGDRPESPKKGPSTTEPAANPNVLGFSPEPSKRAGPGKVAVGLMVLAVAGGVLGAVWISQIGPIEEETAALEADRTAAESRLSGIESEIAGLEDEVAGLEEQVAAALAEADRLTAEADGIDSAVAVRTASFEASIVDEIALAGTLLEYEELLLGLADLDRRVARSLAAVDARFAGGVAAGNRRNLDDMAEAISVEELEALLDDLEDARAALEAAAAEIESLAEELPPTEEAGDG